MSHLTPLLFVFGLVVGTFGTMLGVGGGFLHVPFFILVFDLEPQAAIATSITIIFVNTLGGSLKYFSQGRLDLDLAKKLSLAVLPGAMIGPFIVERYTGSFFMILFSCALVLCALYLAVGKVAKGAATTAHPTRTIRDAFGETVSYSPNVELGVVGTFVIGFLSNLLGVGGGIIHVPYLILFLRVPTHIAIGTSHFILCVSSGVGMIMFIFLRRVNVDFAIPTGIGAILGATIGAEFARKTNAVALRRGLAVVLAAVAVNMFFKASGRG